MTDLCSSVHGELSFSSMEMEAPPNAPKTGGRLTGEVMTKYMESFYEQFLRNRILFNTEVLNIKRGENNNGWIIQVEDLTKGITSDLRFAKIVLCTGVSHLPFLLGNIIHLRNRAAATLVSLHISPPM